MYKRSQIRIGNYIISENYGFDVGSFFHILQMTKCLVGNTSAAIREGSFIGVPTVSIGTRQNDRERGKNVLDAKYESADI